jgi:hypothetical protein
MLYIMSIINLDHADLYKNVEQKLHMTVYYGFLANR